MSWQELACQHSVPRYLSSRAGTWVPEQLAGQPQCIPSAYAARRFGPYLASSIKFPGAEPGARCSGLVHDSKLPTWCCLVAVDRKTELQHVEK